MITLLPHVTCRWSEEGETLRWQACPCCSSHYVKKRERAGGRVDRVTTATATACGVPCYIIKLWGGGRVKRTSCTSDLPASSIS